jgi:hypothetical protein
VLRRALLNFMHRDGWSFHILAEDCKTVLVCYRKVAARRTYCVSIAKLEGSVADVELDIRRWRRESVWIEPSPASAASSASAEKSPKRASTRDFLLRSS